ncbi:MAG: lysine--tRNA ligase [Phycisphaerales bacterium]|nr:lysine--tRNA ligase [Phycisphaerales bacterium]NNM27743.1 lysine--tRNA ligase [Phycisphaerales bacterium]
MNDSGGNPTAEERDTLVRARREKLARWRETYGVTGYGHRVDDLVALAEARGRFDADAQAAVDADPADEKRPEARVAGRCIQHRPMGKLVFIVLRDDTGDLQISVSKDRVDAASFKIAQKLDYGDIVVAGGRVGATRKGEVCVWADSFELHAKSLVPPPEKYHGLTDPELRYRQRYVDLFANPEARRTLEQRSRIIAFIRRFMDGRGFLEVETPVMQPIAGGAAARPFVTHHNALGMDLFLRIAPELYLKRLLVGGMPRVYEVCRNFRNEGVDRSHNPEFTALEVYEAFGDCLTMLELTESLLRGLAEHVAGTTPARLPFGDLEIDWSRPFDRVPYETLFRDTLGFEMADETAVRAAAAELHVEDAATRDHWLLVNEVYEARCEPRIDATRPTFVTDYPSAISPLTRPQTDRPELSHRWELLVGGMELGTAYTELNDPDLQLAKLTEQLAGADEEESTFRSLDEDFIHALRVGMPPAGGLGLGVDRIVMLLTNAASIRDVIFFPLMKPVGGSTDPDRGDGSG